MFIFGGETVPNFCCLSTEGVALNHEHGLIQGISDNFDANLSTQNGLKQTHSMATAPSISEERQPIPRVKQKEVKEVRLEDAEYKIYTGEKKPDMPK